MLDVVFDVALVTLKQKKSEMVVILINKSIALVRKSDKKKNKMKKLAETLKLLEEKRN